MSDKHYKASWCMALKVISFLCTILLTAIIIGIASTVIKTESPYVMEAQGIIFGVIFPALMLIGGALFSIRGYAVQKDRFLIKRLLWNTSIPLKGITDIQYIPNAMDKSIRLFGNGGLFSISGLMRNKQLGNYRAFATDSKRTVVIKLDKKTIVVTPDNPEDFVAEFKKGLEA